MTRTFSAVTIDVGGVLLVPHHDTLADALNGAGLTFDPSVFWDGHYAAMHSVDVHESEPESFSDYVPAFCQHLGLVGEEHSSAVEALEPLFGPSSLWCEPVVESEAGLAALAEAGVPRLVLSNADGTVDELLARTGICQVGPGPRVEVLAVIDSGAFGHAKPDRRIFEEALRLLDLPADRVLHVGDSVHYDVDGARAAGLQAVHFDPRRLCERDDHDHVRSLAQLVDRWDQTHIGPPRQV